jgi:acyl-CoA thioester hydrolase
MDMPLMTKTTVKVRFSEVDLMGIVWHGQYIKYFEDGREDFGNKFGINYLDFNKNDFVVPIVKIECNYKKPLVYGDTVMVETRFIDCDAAKLIFNYTLYKGINNEIIATGLSTQVFMSLQHELLLNFPPFFLEWKKRNGLITSSR